MYNNFFVEVVLTSYRQTHVRMNMARGVILLESSDDMEIFPKISISLAWSFDKSFCGNRGIGGATTRGEVISVVNLFLNHDSSEKNKIDC